LLTCSVLIQRGKQTAPSWDFNFHFSPSHKLCGVACPRSWVLESRSWSSYPHMLQGSHLVSMCGRHSALWAVWGQWKERYSPRRRWVPGALRQDQARNPWAPAFIFSPYPCWFTPPGSGNGSVASSN
jgi:hypothetical protein